MFTHLEHRAAREASPVRLADGTQVLIRELANSDEDAIRAFYRGLSPSTLHRRFLSPYATLPDSMLRYLAAPGPDRYVVVAFHGAAIVGEARVHRAGGSGGGEVAVVVADAWQGRGLGTELVRRLLDLARARGLTAFTGTLRADNGAALALLTSMAPAADRRIRSGELEFRARLPVSRAPVSGPCAGTGRSGATSRVDPTRGRSSATSRIDR
jgi:acetyltransferase